MDIIIGIATGTGVILTLILSYYGLKKTMENSIKEHMAAVCVPQCNEIRNLKKVNKVMVRSHITQLDSLERISKKEETNGEIGKRQKELDTVLQDILFDTEEKK